MKALFPTFLAWFRTRSPRERWMLGLLGAALLLFFGWLSARPLWDWRADAADRRTAAARDLAEVRLAMAATEGGEISGATTPADQIEAAAMRLAAPLGFEPALEAVVGGVAFTTESVTSAVLFDWLSGLGGERIEARSLIVTENVDATLKAEGLLAGV